MSQQVLQLLYPYQPIQPNIQIVNNYDEDNAYVVRQFPYCFGVNTQIRYWVETRESLGQRLVYRTFNPIENKWLKQKPSQYVDIVILEVVKDQDSLDHNLVIPKMFILTSLGNDELFALVQRFSYTPFQRRMLILELHRRGYASPPVDYWKTEPQINQELCRWAETLPKSWAEANKQRLTNEVGIPIESLYDAQKRINREKRMAKALGRFQKRELNATKIAQNNWEKYQKNHLPEHADSLPKPTPQNSVPAEHFYKPVLQQMKEKYPQVKFDKDLIDAIKDCTLEQADATIAMHIELMRP